MHQKPLLVWYIYSALTDDDKRQAIKDILSTACSKAIQDLLQLNQDLQQLKMNQQPLLVWYIYSALTDEDKRQAIKDILSTTCSKAIQDLLQLNQDLQQLKMNQQPLLAWYIYSTLKTTTSDKPLKIFFQQHAVRRFRICCNSK